MRYRLRTFTDDGRVFEDDVSLLPTTEAILAGCAAYTMDGHLRPHQDIYGAVESVLREGFKAQFKKALGHE